MFFLFLLILQAIRLKYLHPDSELHNFALQVMEMLRVDTSADAQALVCFLTICFFNFVEMCLMMRSDKVCIVRFVWVCE